MEKRFIEESFPVREVSEQSASEKNIRKGHISSLHIWWARRPLSSSRATNYAALIPAAEDEIDWVKKRNFIIELSKWENSLNHNILEKARENILNNNNGVSPKVLDPFSGGGAIPLEALRLGCETYANDYNPIAVLIEKCTLEYPQKYGIVKGKWAENRSKLVDDIEIWGNWVFEETKKEIGKFYPLENGFIPVGYLWARTIPCQNPSCSAEIPLVKQFWLSKKKNKKIALKPVINGKNIDFEILGDKNPIPNDFDPSKGTVSRAVSQCLVCGSVIEAKTTRKLFQEGKSGERIIAVVLSNPKKSGKLYRPVNPDDIHIFSKAEQYLKFKRKKLKSKWGIDPIPDELIPLMSGTFNVPLYGFKEWGDLFNSRQKLALVTFFEKIKELYEILILEGYDEDYAKAITTYIGFIVSRCSDFESNIVRWFNHVENTCNTFARQALPMMWDYFELNLFSPVSQGTFKSMHRQVLKSVEFLTNIDYPENSIVTNFTATNLQYEENFFDAVFTDPPYYNSVPYADLSDFFYVWLKRAFDTIHPELFSTPLTPKSNEITEMAGWDKKRYSNKDKNFFENMLKKSFKEIYRVLKPNGITTIVYAHKTTEGWETVINSLLDSGLTVVASWPISTEMVGRLRAQRSASLASSIYIVAKKFDKKDLGWFKEVKSEIEQYVPEKLDKLWEEGISGADFFISAIGSAIEIFGKYEKILDNEGNEIRADKLLSCVRDVVSDYTVRQILHDSIADELSPVTKYYLMFRWNYGEARVHFDEARKLAQSAGIDLANEWNKGLIVKRGEFITVQGPDKRDITGLKKSRELIDVIHHVCLLWKEGKKEKISLIIKESGYGEGESIYKVAQAISETLLNTSSEKKMIEGFLAGREQIMQTVREDESQTKLL